ncbi:MAG TPA: GNAT family N-acetyltransferase [Hyphomicrobiaceae bacterium]|nr:GNAT family N-acetyltransferase [Hyphomicrobiaceae bacterium]
MLTLTTQRLLLRPFQTADAPQFARLAGDWAVASMTSDIPHPFDAEQALAWLKPARGEVRFAIVGDGGQLIGGAGYYRRPSGIAELGFWLGKPWWGQGYATEAARAVLAHGSRDRRLPGFSSAHFVDNPASGRVLAKLGFTPVERIPIACAARGYHVDAITYRLERHRALLLIASAGERRPVRRRWRTWLGRIGAD